MIDFGKQLQDAYDDGYKQRDLEIVRCKDCVYHGEFDESGWCTCESTGAGMHKDGFCSDGERKTK